MSDDGDADLPPRDKRLARYRDPPERFRLPVVGERVETPDGPGRVEMVEDWSEFRHRCSPSELQRIRGQLADNFTITFAYVTVDLDAVDDTRDYPIWELWYDLERRDDDDPPWRG